MVEKLVFRLTLFTPVLDTNYAYISEMYIYHRYMTLSFRALAVSNSKCHSDNYVQVCIGNVHSVDLTLSHTSSSLLSSSNVVHDIT